MKIPATMRAWSSHGAGPGSLRFGEAPVPAPTESEILVKVSACGVCRTDLHVVAGDLPLHKAPVVPGHEIVGTVVAVGGAAEGFVIGDRAGIAWLRSTCGACAWCRRGAENLCERSEYTGWDHDGGYAEYVVAPAAYAFRVPEGIEDVQMAPLLCAGIIGYRSLRRAAVPSGGSLGIYGFGASAHLTTQVALAQGIAVYVMTRDESARHLALELGAAWAGGAAEDPPVRLDSAIVFAPAGGSYRRLWRPWTRTAPWPWREFI